MTPCKPFSLAQFKVAVKGFNIIVFKHFISQTIEHLNSLEVVVHSQKVDKFPGRDKA